MSLVVWVFCVPNHLSNLEVFLKYFVMLHDLKIVLDFEAVCWCGVCCILVGLGACGAISHTPYFPCLAVVSLEPNLVSFFVIICTVGEG